MKLTPEERYVLEKMSVKGLQFLARIESDKDFKTLIDIVNFLIDYEKNQVFAMKENDKDKLAVEHAFSRGIVAGESKVLILIKAAQGELSRREELREKKSEERRSQNG